ncbi:MAG TPA: MBL fold metallo-hydrolase [Symbiobacteriaceae bacterium]|nr:MBL fold metallo-hydrolase [Symbiobacteriaceae bacterium]
MRLTFLGAAGMVTGSCYLLEAGGLRLMVDCGMFQGKEEDLNREPFGVHPGTLDGVILTHAHIDHSGRLPLLRKQGFHGPIYAHQATADLAEIMLLDSAHIQEMEAERDNRKNRRADKGVIEPLYTQIDAKAVAAQFYTIPYGEPFNVGDNLQIRLLDAGHILGSAIVEIYETDKSGHSTKLVFSGDLGQPDRPILQDPAIVEDADYLLLESTYGNRVHEPKQSTREKLADIIRTTIEGGGNVVIPAFAVGRTQELLYALNELVEQKQLPKNLKVVLDSPLAIAATEVTEKHHEIFDETAKVLMRRGDQPFKFPGLVLSRTAEDSKALNESKEPKVIIAASGMCEAGRIVHHLKHNLWRQDSTVLFVGYQAEGTLGRRILDGASPVRIHGEEIAVRARIESLAGLSAHADQEQLLAWVAGLQRLPLQTILIHGEAEGREELARRLMTRGHRVMLPVMGQVMSLPSPGTAAARRPAKPVAVPKDPARVAQTKSAALSVSSQRMSALIKELKNLRKVWNTNGPHMPPGQAEELARRAGDLLRNVEEIRRIIEAAGE